MVLVVDKPTKMIGHEDPIAIVIRFLHAGRKRATLPGTEESLATTIEFSTAFFWQVDDQLAGLPHPPRRPSGPVRASPGGSCMPSLVGGTERSLAG